MRRSVVVSTLLLMGLLSSSPAQAAAITFRSVVDANTQHLGVEVSLTGLEDLLAETGTVGILGFDFDVSFDPSILPPDFSAADFYVSPGSVLGPEPSNFYGAFQLAPLGPVTVIATMLGPVAPATSDGVLATLFFSRLLATSPVFGVSDAHVQGLFADGSSPDSAFAVPVENPTPPQAVPEPSTLGLLCIGLAAMARRMRRKTQVPAPIERAAH